jgi:hypothetical protein
MIADHADHVDTKVVEELFRERIIPYLGTAQTEKAVKATESVYKSLCGHQPAKENLSFLYQKFLSTYEYVRQPASRQAILDCIQYLNSAVRNNPALA